MRKIIILASLILLLFAGINSYSQEPPPTPRENSQNWQSCTTKTDKNGDTHQDCTQKEPLLIKTLKDSEITNQNHDKQGRDIEQKSSFKNRIEIISIAVTAIATAFIAIFTICLVCYNKKMAKSLQAIERAYLVVDSIEWINKNGPSALSEFNKSTIKIKLANIGKTSSFIRVLNCKIIFKEDGYPSKKELNFAMPLDPPEYIINGGGNEIVDYNQVISPLIMSEEKFSQSIILCYGCVEYEDIFRNRRETGFCYELSPKETRSRFRISNNRELNYHT